MKDDNKILCTNLLHLSVIVTHTHNIDKPTNYGI